MPNRGAIVSYDAATLAQKFVCLGAGGAVTLIDQPSGPVQHLLLGGGKEGKLYLLNRDSMGHYNAASDTQIVQSFSVGQGIFSTPAIWQNSLYINPLGGPVKAFAFNPSTGLFNSTPASQTTQTYGFPGAMVATSSQGSANGILWVLDNSGYDGPTGPKPAILQAYDANNLGNLLYSSSTTGTEVASRAVKFSVPTVANGKVYVGGQGSFTVFGLHGN